MNILSRAVRLSAITAFLATPLLAVAQTGIDISKIKQPYSDRIIYVINYILVPVLMAIAFIVFLWGVYQYFIQGAAEEDSRTKGRQFTLWGVIGFVVIFSLWGLVNLIMGTLGFSVGTTAPAPPTFHGSSSYSGGAGAGGGSYTPFGVPAGSNTGLVAEYNSMLSTCSSTGDLSSQCQQARTNYLQNLNATDPANASYNTCVYANGGDPAICQCEASGGVWSLNDRTCSNGSTSDSTPTDSGSGTASAYLQCTQNGGDPDQCYCSEVQHGSWNLTDGVCE